MVTVDYSESHIKMSMLTRSNSANFRGQELVIQLVFAKKGSTNCLERSTIRTKASSKVSTLKVLQKNCLISTGTALKIGSPVYRPSYRAVSA